MTGINNFLIFTLAKYAAKYAAKYVAPEAKQSKAGVLP